MAPRQLKTHNNIIENEAAMIPILAMFSKQFDEYQSQRTEVDDKVVVADAMDNCSENGHKFRSAVMAFARSWTKDGLVRDGFLEYMDQKGITKRDGDVRVLR